MNRVLVAALLAAVASLVVPRSAHAESPVRGVIPHSRKPIVMDGKLDEWDGAFSTPVNFGHADWENRAAVWHYLWDEQNLYIGLECLDTTVFNKAPGPIYNGDGVEFYLDCRAGAELGSAQWTPGSLHLFYTAASNGEIKPRIQIRGGIPAFRGVTTEGMEAAATRTPAGYTLEFRLPWSKFPGFQPGNGRDLGIDCELCSSDGGPRVDRCWVYSGVAAVGSPGVLGRMRLVDRWNPAEAGPYSEVLFPIFLARSSPSGDPATLFAGISPALQPLVRRVELKAGTQDLPFVGIKRFGAGWSRIQACLVGFLPPDTKEVTLRILGENDRVLGTRVVPVGR